MALKATYDETKFGVGDEVRVLQKIKEGKRVRTQAFEGMVIGIKGHGEGKSFTVRRIGAAQVGIERIFPLNTPTIESIQVKRKGGSGVRRAKLYYTRDKHMREIENIYARDKRKNESIKESKKSKSTSKKGKTKRKAS